MADKFLNHFDLSNPWTYQDFINSIELSLYQIDDFFYKITFEAFDYNSDSFLSEVDLFLVLKDTKDDELLKTLSFDLSTIIQFISKKKKIKGTHDDVQYRYKRLMKRLSKIKKQVRLKSGSRDEEPKNSTNNFFEFMTQALVSNNNSSKMSVDSSIEQWGEDTPTSTTRKISNFGISNRKNSLSYKPNDSTISLINCFYLRFPVLDVII